MSGYAATTRDARQAFVSYYPFESPNGGLGVSLALTTTSGTTSRTALVGEGVQVLITNKGQFAAHIAFGDSTVVATTAWTCILPGIPYTLTLPPLATHVAGVADSDTTVQITRGYGN